MNKGERISNRTKSTIKIALLDLITKRNYPEIKVSDITETGNVGRSTFYRHYQSKADVLVDIHKDIFVHLFSSMSTAESWLNPQPPRELCAFLEKYKKSGQNPFSLSYKLGNDLDYLINNINRRLTETIEERIRDSFLSNDCDMPLPVLAQSISALYIGLIVSWFTRFQSIDAERFAVYIHRNMRALILEAIKKESLG